MRVEADLDSGPRLDTGPESSEGQQVGAGYCIMSRTDRLST